MFKYLVRRLLISIPVLLAVTVIVFILTELAPGDMIDYFIASEAQMTADALEQMRARFGLDKPLAVRYVNWLGSVVQGDLGFSFVEGRPVADLVGRRLSASLLLVGTALLIGVGAGIPLGILTALRQYSFIDFFLTGVSFLGISMPAFIAGIFGLYVFSITLGWFPAGGMRPVDRVPTLWDSIHYLILPSVILSLQYIASYMRYTRFSMLEVIRSDYITTARSKGLRERGVIWRHMVPNAILPVITVIGFSIPNLVVGAVFTETIFSWPGMGTLYRTAVQGRDVPLLMGMNLVIAIVVLLANIVTDLVYAVVDPRIRYE